MPTMAKRSRAPAPRRTVEVRMTDVDDVYAADAVIEAVRQATVAAQLSGAVTQILVDAGDRVKKGQVLARIDTRETDAQVAAGRASVAQADAQLTQARLNLERTQSLLDKNFVSRAALDQAESNFKAAKAAADAARAGNTQADTARTYAELRSPIDGVVTRRLMEPGEIAAPGRGVVALHDPSALRAVATCRSSCCRRPRRNAGNGRAAATRSHAQCDAGHDPSSRRRPAAVHADPCRPARRRYTGSDPGRGREDPRVHLAATRKLVVPESTLIRRGELTAVNVLAADGRPQLRQVRVGSALADGGIEVLAGLSDGERVLLNPLAAR